MKKLFGLGAVVFALLCNGCGAAATCAAIDLAANTAKGVCALITYTDENGQKQEIQVSAEELSVAAALAADKQGKPLPEGKLSTTYVECGK